MEHDKHPPFQDSAGPDLVYVFLPVFGSLDLCCLLSVFFDEWYSEAWQEPPPNLMWLIISEPHREEAAVLQAAEARWCDRELSNMWWPGRSTQRTPSLRTMTRSTGAARPCWTTSSSTSRKEQLLQSFAFPVQCLTRDLCLFGLWSLK